MMGQCFWSSKEYADIIQKIDAINAQLVGLDDIKNENALLRHQATLLQMKIENYGMMFSGNPCRITPPSWEISKRLGYNTF